MGNANGSGGGSDGGNEEDQMGYRVLGVQADSPAASAGLVSFFDFIVGANGTPLRRLDNTFIDLIREFEDRPLAIQIYNSKSQLTRDVIITPSSKWDGQGMLGVTIRFDCYENADEHLVRVLEVVPNSPAELAGLQPNLDFLLGTAEMSFRDADALEEVLTKSLDHTVDLYVYNTETDTVRITTIMPTLKWGGSGCLGAAVGHGYLHALPANCTASNGTSVFRSPAPHITDATRSTSRRATPVPNDPHAPPVVLGEEGKSPSASSPPPSSTAPPPPPPTHAPMVSVVDVDLSRGSIVPPPPGDPSLSPME